ncbi:CBS domain-containing protein [uncultured Clostridium sp.]|uniref:CBS domain-containing protein n=1 Tax=uncultured Clostridium sp. TaxID=59620 RepID=UPI0028EBB8DF|nr:CBS domain-containing protein [uncultured Clostridium sp.]
MKVKDVMTKTLATLSPEDTVERAAQMMREHNIGSLPICQEDKVIGIITDRDVALRSAAEGENAQRQTVRDIMSSNPVIVSPEIEAKEAARIMSERQIRRLPVVENNSLVGMLSLGDLSVEPNLSNKAGETLTNISEPSSPSIQ